jgi:hypothetical protein
MLEINNYENLLFTGDIPKGWKLQRSIIEGFTFYMVSYPTLKELLERTHAVDITLLDTGELVYILTGWDKEEDARAHEGTIYVGKGVIHGKVVRCQD